MVRSPRIIIPETPHHVVHKGNKSNQIFFNDYDYETYLSLLKLYSKKYACSILSYCLMPNHIHLVCIPPKSESLISLIRDTHKQYSKILNHKLSTSGHNWQNRYFSCPCDEFYCIASMSYTELNPVRASIVKQAWYYPWSSAGSHAGFSRNGNPELLDMSWWGERFTPSGWRELLMRGDNPELVIKINNHTFNSIPLKNDKIIQDLQEVII